MEHDSEHNSVMMANLEKGDLVLFTGRSGYDGWILDSVFCAVASQTANQFLEAGYRVRGTVRSKEKADWLYEVPNTKYGKGKFEHFVVEDMTSEGAFDEAVKGVAGICHMTNVMTFRDKYDDVVPVVVKGALNALTAAMKEAGMKAFVYTSSSTAALMPQPDEVIKVTEETWNDVVVKDAKTKPISWNVYCASEIEAERAIWKAVKDAHPPFQVAAILPNADMGPISRPGGEQQSSTASWVLKL